MTNHKSLPVDQWNGVQERLARYPRTSSKKVKSDFKRDTINDFFQVFPISRRRDTNDETVFVESQEEFEARDRSYREDAKKVRDS